MAPSVLAGRFELGAPIGRGGSGVVVSAVDLQTGHRVAVKRLHPALVRDEGLRLRLLREADALCRVDHPNLVRVIAAGADELGAPFVVSERVDAPRLAELLAASPEGLPAPLVARLVVQVLDALSALHDVGCHHRDLKPDNVFVRGAPGHEQALLFDLGAAWLDGGSDLTPAGVAMGSPAYASPERVRGDAAEDPRSDVWAAGILLFEALTGERPFRGRMADLVRSVLEDEPVPLSAYRNDVPPALAAVVDRALAKAPDDRFADARAMRDALVRATTG